MKVNATVDSEDLKFKLGTWLASLKSFLHLYNSKMIVANYLTYDFSKEVRLIHSTLQLCSKLTIDLLHQLESETSSNKEEKLEPLDNESLGLEYEIFSEKEILHLSFVLKELILFSEVLLRSGSLGFQDWTIWGKSLEDKLNEVDSVQKLIRDAERESGEFLPEKVKALLDKNTDINPRLLSDLKIILPQLARILKLLGIIGKMLKKDKPLKPSLLLFARVNELMREMVDYINSRLMWYPNKQDAIFSSMQSLEYIASVELRKVYDRELKDLIKVRSIPVMFAKIERSFSLLNDSMQFTMLNFAQLIKPDLRFSEVFPSLKSKEEKSILLREEMWSVLRVLKEIEKDPENYPIDALSEKLIKFKKMIIGVLFYKDIKTVQKFIGEILKSEEKEELLMNLHRFQVYLETLLGQINMRAVLSNHPFAPLEQNTLDVLA